MKLMNKWNTAICFLMFTACTIPSITTATPLPAVFNNNNPAVYEVINHVIGSSYTDNSELESIYTTDDDYWSDLSWWEITSTSAGYRNALGIVNASGYQTISDRVNGFEIFSETTFSGSFSNTGIFEFALSVNNEGARYYSNPLHNTYDNQLDHMLTFSLGAFNYGGHSYKNGYLLAWEDLLIGKSDHDYNDTTFLVDASPSPVPEPGAMLLFGAGLAGFAGLRFRKMKK